MTVKEFYEATGGSYEAAVARLMSDRLIIRFAGKFPEDGCFLALTQALDSGDVETAFRSAHTLKGLALNLEFQKLAHSAAKITEMLRAGNLEDARAYAGQVREDYEMTVEKVRQLIASQA